VLAIVSYPISCRYSSMQYVVKTEKNGDSKIRKAFVLFIYVGLLAIYLGVFWGQANALTITAVIIQSLWFYSTILFYKSPARDLDVKTVPKGVPITPRFYTSTARVLKDLREICLVVKEGETPEKYRNDLRYGHLDWRIVEKFDAQKITLLRNYFFKEPEEPKLENMADQKPT